jgi:perosamine synthetase
MADHPFIPVNEPLLEGNELKYATEAIQTGWISSEGPFVKDFEQKFADRCDRKHGISVANGSAALEIAVKAAGINEGDEVIMPAFTIISCAAAVVKAGGVPVLVDSVPDSWNMDVSQVESKITPKTKAIMPVHIYGLPTDMAPLMDIAQKHKLTVIEDAAEAHGQSYKGKPCGSFGQMSVFSFYPNKHVTTGEGGMMVTDDEELAEKCRSLRNLCFQPRKRFVHEELGWNYRFSNLQAAIGLAQLEQLDSFIQKKKRMGAYYTEALQNVPGIELPMTKTTYAQNHYWVFGIVLKEEIPFDAQEAMQRLKAEAIGTRPFFYPMHLQPVFRRMGLFQDESYPESERLAGRGFYIPSGLKLNEAQMERVVKVLKSLIT